MRMCTECGYVNSHSPNCPEAEDLPHNFRQCEECGGVEESRFINDQGWCVNCEDHAHA